MSNQMLSRRGMLAWSGGTLFLASSGGLLHAAGPGAALPDGDAYSPWTLWNDKAVRGTPLALVAAAVLAANPHDTQPWLFRVSDHRIELFADLGRNLGAMDSFLREMHLGLGCAVQNILLAAGPNGYDAALEVDAGSLLDLASRRGMARAAVVHLARRQASAPDQLCRAIPERHTNRYAYDRARSLPAEWLAFAAHADTDDDVRVFLFAEGAERLAFNAAVIDATNAIIADRAMIADSDRWLRTSPDEIAAHRDGPTLEAAGLSTFTYLLARYVPLPAALAHDAWLAQTRDTQLASAPLTGLIAVRNRYDRNSTIAAGRTWQRLHLSAVEHGIGLQPLNQPIEMVDRERAAGRGRTWHARMAEITGDDWQATFSFRAGYPSQQAPASPRRALREVIVE